MGIQTLVKKIEKLEKEIEKLDAPKEITGKIHVDQKVLQQASKALFDFDIEKFVTKKDLKEWKSS